MNRVEKFGVIDVLIDGDLDHFVLNITRSWRSDKSYRFLCLSEL